MRVGEMFLILTEEGARLGMPGSATDTASAQAVSFTSKNSNPNYVLTTNVVTALLNKILSQHSIDFGGRV